MSALVPMPNDMASISSKDLSLLTNKRHDSVKRTIETLADSGVIQLPQSVISEEINGLGLKQKTKLYLFTQFNKRDSYIIVAQLSPEFTARLVDRWQELEAKQAFQIPTTLSGALMLAAQQAEQIEQLQIQAKNDAPKVQFAEAVRKIDGSCKIEHFSKTLQIGRNTFFKMLKADGILMPDRMPYQRYIDNGCFVVIEQIPYTDKDGRTHPTFTTMVTGKGQVWLEKKYRAAVQERHAA